MVTTSHATGLEKTLFPATKSKLAGTLSNVVMESLCQSFSIKNYHKKKRRLIVGPLMGGPQCRVLILRNGNVICPCRLFHPKSHVEFKSRLCRMSL